jgi:hypothetical protein
MNSGKSSIIANYYRSGSGGKITPNARKGRHGAVPFSLIPNRLEGWLPLDNLDVLSLPALGTLGHVELNALALLQ